MPQINLDDPKLTAYALGELEPTEAAELEQLLKDDAAARACVEEVRAQAAALEKELSAEAAPGLTDAQKQAIAASAGGAIAVPLSQIGRAHV